MTNERKSATCDTFPFASHDRIIPIGWLRVNQPFESGKTDRQVFERLQELLKSPWQPFILMGVHECELCQFAGEAFGNSNLYVPSGDCIFVAPELIAHYMNAHHYRPPDDFCRAILECPPMRSQAYRAAISKTGLLTELRNPIEHRYGGNALMDETDCTVLTDEDTNRMRN